MEFLFQCYSNKNTSNNIPIHLKSLNFTTNENKTAISTIFQPIKRPISNGSIISAHKTKVNVNK